MNHSASCFEPVQHTSSARMDLRLHCILTGAPNFYSPFFRFGHLWPRYFNLPCALTFVHYSRIRFGALPLFLQSPLSSDFSWFRLVSWHLHVWFSLPSEPLLPRWSRFLRFSYSKRPKRKNCLVTRFVFLHLMWPQKGILILPKLNSEALQPMKGLCLIHNFPPFGAVLRIFPPVLNAAGYCRSF